MTVSWRVLVRGMCPGNEIWRVLTMTVSWRVLVRLWTISLETLWASSGALDRKKFTSLGNYL